jgi:hypothetical protein
MRVKFKIKPNGTPIEKLSQDSNDVNLTFFRHLSMFCRRFPSLPIQLLVLI